MHFDNYETDHRVRAGRRGDWFKTLNESTLTATITTETDDGEETLDIPVRFDVCPTCDGRGSHVNPSIDCDGLTQEDFAEDPDFLEDYVRGAYDVPCYGCGGKRVVAVPDEDRCDPEVLKQLHQKQEADAAYAREREYERRMGY